MFHGTPLSLRVDLQADSTRTGIKSTVGSLLPPPKQSQDLLLPSSRPRRAEILGQWLSRVRGGIEEQEIPVSCLSAAATSDALVPNLRSCSDASPVPSSANHSISLNNKEPQIGLPLHSPSFMAHYNQGHYGQYGGGTGGASGNETDAPYVPNHLHNHHHHHHPGLYSPYGGGFPPFLMPTGAPPAYQFQGYPPPYSHDSTPLSMPQPQERRAQHPASMASAAASPGSLPSHRTSGLPPVAAMNAPLPHPSNSGSSIGGVLPASFSPATSAMAAAAAAVVPLGISPGALARQQRAQVDSMRGKRRRPMHGSAAGRGAAAGSGGEGDGGGAGAAEASISSSRSTMAAGEAEGGISSGALKQQVRHQQEQEQQVSSQVESKVSRPTQGRPQAQGGIKEERKRKRLLRNRVSAQLARERKRHHMEELESRCNQVASSNKSLEERIAKLTQENEELRSVVRNNMRGRTSVVVDRGESDKQGSGAAPASACSYGGPSYSATFLQSTPSYTPATRPIGLFAETSSGLGHEATGNTSRYAEFTEGGSQSGASEDDEDEDEEEEEVEDEEQDE